MKQVLFGGIYDALHATDTEYNTLQNGIAWTATLGNAECPMPTPGTISGPEE